MVHLLTLMRRARIISAETRHLPLPEQVNELLNQVDRIGEFFRELERRPDLPPGGTVALMLRVQQTMIMEERAAYNQYLQGVDRSIRAAMAKTKSTAESAAALEAIHNSIERTMNSRWQ